MKRIAIFTLLAALSLTVVGCTAKTDNNQNAVVKTIMERRSIRKFQPQTVDRATLDIILECGINAPNGQNKQSWAVRVIDTPEAMARLHEIMAASRPDVDAEQVVGCLRGAPVMVFIARETSYAMSAIDCGLMAENICLSAWSLGVGSICLGSPLMFLSTPEAKEFLQLGESEELVLGIGLGYADEQPEAKPRDRSKIRYIE